jgi:hypothetical protein
MSVSQVDSTAVSRFGSECRTVKVRQCVVPALIGHRYDINVYVFEGGTRMWRGLLRLKAQGLWLKAAPKALAESSSIATRREP